MCSFILQFSCTFRNSWFMYRFLALLLIVSEKTYVISVQWHENNKKKHHTVGTAPKFNRKIVERSKIDTPNTQILDNSLFWSGIDNSIKRICGIHWFCYVNIAEVNNTFQGMGTRKRQLIKLLETNKGNNKITKLRTILQRESQNS